MTSPSGISPYLPPSPVKICLNHCLPTKLPDKKTLPTNTSADLHRLTFKAPGGISHLSHTLQTIGMVQSTFSHTGTRRRITFASIVARIARMGTIRHSRASGWIRYGIRVHNCMAWLNQILKSTSSVSSSASSKCRMMGRKRLTQVGVRNW